MRTRLWPILAIGLMALPSDVSAGAWTIENGRGQVIVTATPSGANQAFDESRNLQTTPRYRKFELQGLFEYGVTERLTALVSVGLQRIDIGAPTNARRFGLGYTDIGARYRLVQRRNWVISGQTTLRLPGTFDTQSPAAIGYNGFEVDVRGLFGYGFSAGRWPAFVDLQVAQRFRSGGPPNEFRGDATLGVRPRPKWLVLGQAFNVVSEGSGDLRFPRYNYSKLQLSVVHDLTERWAVQAGAFTTFSGRDALQENGLIFSVWYRF